MSDLPRILIARGDWLSEDVTTRCTGCGEVTIFSWRAWKGDFTGNRSDFEQFCNWATWYASLHECFLAGRVGYITGTKFVPPPTPLERHASKPDDPLTYHVDFPQVERHEDPWGGAGYVVEPEGKRDRILREAMNPLMQGDDEPCLTCGALPICFIDGDCPECNPLIPDAWIDEELDLPPLPFACGIGDIVDTEAIALLLNEKDAEQGLHESDNYDRAEVGFDFLYDVHEPYGTVTGRMRQDPHYGMELEPMPPALPEYRKTVTTWFDKQRAVDEYLLTLGIYSLDALGCLRDEKGRCLACLRPGPHFPFYYDRDKR